MTHIAVIGAGITGVTTAYSLVSKGYEVTLYDRHRYAAMETSYANGGQLSVSNAEVWNQWGTIFKALRWLWHPDAPLLVNLTPGWHKISWMGEFLANIPRYRQNTLETVKLALVARQALLEIADKEGISFDLERRGILHIYHNAHDLAHARQVNVLLNEGGLEREEISSSEISRIEPTLKGSFAGGFFTPSDCTGDIHLFSRGLSEVCGKKGVHLVYNAEVETLSAPGNGISVKTTDAVETGFDAVVICAGVASRRFAAQLGDRVNVYPVKGYSITVHLNDETSRSSAPWVSILDDKVKIVSSRLGVERLRIAGTAEFNGGNRDIRADRIDPLLEWCEQLFPDVSTEEAVPWSGLRPMSPSMLPRVGRGSKRGVYYNTGHGHLGWTLSAGTASIIADIIASDFADGQG